MSDIPKWEDTEEEIPKWDDTEEETKVSQLEAGVRGLAQGASFGLSDEAEAALKSALSPREYDEVLAEVRERQRTASREHPGTYMAGEIGGGIGTAMLPGGLLAKGASKIGSIGRGAVEGAAHGFGRGEGTEDRVKGAGEGAAIGGIFSSLGAAGKKLYGEAMELLGKKQLKQVGLQNKDFKKLGQDGQKEALKLAKDNKLITADPKKTLLRASEARDAAIADLRAVKEELGDLGEGMFNSAKIADDIEKNILPRYSTRKTADSQKKLIEQYVEDLRSTPNDFRALNEVREDLGLDLAESSGKTRKALQGVYAQFKDSFSENLEEVGKKVKDPELASRYSEANKKFRLLNNMADAAEDEANKGVMRGLDIGFKDLATTGVAGSVTGDMGTTAGLLVGRKLAAKYGVSAVTKAQDILRKGGPAAAPLKKALGDGNTARAAMIIALSDKE
jgi:hypothetical protein